MRDFIFIHIPRTAGTSMTKALQPFSSQSSFNGHVTALEIIERIDRRKFCLAFSFTVIRNPWDRQVSFYEYIRRDSAHHLHRRVRAGDFKMYVKRVLLMEPRLTMSLVDYLCSWTGKQLVNFVGRFERLGKDFQAICKELRVEAILPKLNTSLRKPYQEYYDDATAKIVGEVFKEDVLTFGYKF